MSVSLQPNVDQRAKYRGQEKVRVDWIGWNFIRSAGPVVSPALQHREKFREIQWLRPGSRQSIGSAMGAAGARSLEHRQLSRRRHMIDYQMRIRIREIVAAE